MGIAPDSILGQAVSAVNENMAHLNAMTNTFSSQLSVALSQISNVKVDVVPPPEKLTLPETPAPNDPLEAQPTFTPDNFSPGAKPAPVDISNLLNGLDLNDISLPSMPEMPAVTLPDIPAIGDVALPERPAIDTNIELPAAPSIDMPQMDELLQISLPAFEFPQLPTFDATPPSASGIQVPTPFINWSEPQYASELLTDIQAKVKGWMQGGTGLPVAVEQALFSRTRERDGAETERAVQEAVDAWAARDFTMPPGMLVKQADVIREQGRLKASELNRDIMIEAAKWQIEGMRFAVEKGVALEELTSNLHENMTKRLFEAARFHAESQISVFNAQISLFNAQNAGFQTLTEVYKTKLEAAISRITAYKAAVDGQVAIGQINEQRVNVYKAKLEAITSNVEVYKAMMQGAQVRSDMIKNQFDAYRAEVQAYSEQISAEKVKVEAYDARVRAETAKIGVYESQARAYASTIQGLTANADMKMKGAQLRIEAARTRITEFMGNVDAYKAELQSGVSKAQIATSVFTAQIEAWRAKAAAQVAQSEMQSRFADMNTRTNIAYSEMQMSEYTAKMQHAIQQAQIALEAAKAVGQYTAQLAAGALSAAHVSASISGSGSASSSESQSKSESTSYNYSY